jgi:L-seryl-tRNA(Ser) seleniumtransferase
MPQTKPTSNLRNLPSVDQVLQTRAGFVAAEKFGRLAAADAVRKVLAKAREAKAEIGTADAFGAHALALLDAQAQPHLKPVFNLTGTVLHTNLGRALIAEAAVEAANAAMRRAVSLEFDIESGSRGERDDHVRELLCELTGAEDATVVNNNAAAVLLVLNTLAKGRQAIVSRGELIEIGGAFRMPDIMARAGAKLVEVGTTNRTHNKDYAGAINDKTGLVLKVHTSNYKIEGFTREVVASELAELARKHKVPLVNDLGSGTLVDLKRFGLKHEPTVAEAIAEGADLVTFSGDKLLGGPQAGFIVGKKELIEKINRNPMKRALRVDKIRLAILEATLKLYRDPARLVEKLPTMRLLARKQAEVAAQAERLKPFLEKCLNGAFTVEAAGSASQIGSGALPTDVIPSAALMVRVSKSRHSGRALNALAAAFRALPVPVIGRIEKDTLVFDLRCLDDEQAFLKNLESLKVPDTPA